MAVGFTKTENISTYSDVTRLEEEARDICKKLVSATKKYDSCIKKLVLLQV